MAQQNVPSAGPMKILVTGNAGFIGFHTAKRLLERGDSVIGIDVVNGYYDPSIKELLPLQPGDVPDTCADSSELERAVGYKPATPVRQGVANFVAWYREYHNAVGSVANGDTSPIAATWSRWRR